MRTVAVYGRVSTEHEEQLSALNNQIQYYDDIIKKHSDWKLYDRYIDEGITGTSIHKRKSFMRMIHDAEKGCFDLIITREVSRFARNTVDTLQETRKLKKIGVEVYFTEDNIWTFKDDDGELKLTIMATLAQNESKKISQRIKAGQKITFQNGVFYGTGNILGYDKVGKDMIINTEQAKIVRFIYDSYLRGNGLRQIQYELEKRGYQTSTGLTKWNCATINRILRNPFYSGTIVYRKSFIPDYLEQKPKRNTGEVEKVIVEGKHVPIVTKEEFQKVQQLLSKHLTYNKNTQKETKVGKLPTSVWGNKVKCKCGSSMHKRTYHKFKDGHRSWCFQCYDQSNTGSYTSRINHGISVDGICNTKMIPEWKLSLIANVVFERIWIEKEQILEIVNALLEKSLEEDNKSKISTNEILNLERKTLDIDKKQSKLLDTYLSGIITQEDYKNKKNDLDKDKLTLTNRIIELKKEDRTPVVSIEQKVQDFKENISKHLNYKRGEISDELVDSFVDKIIVSNEKLEWHLNFTNEVSNFYSIIDNEDKKEDILIAHLVVTDDDVITYSKYNEELKRVNLKEPIIVDIFM